MWAIIGLGNPGLRYKWSRHNIGFQVVDLWARQYKIRWKKDKFIPAYTGKGLIEGEQVILVKPATYMNRSGQAITGLRKLYGIEARQLLVIIDDIDLAWLNLRIRKQGSSGGHRGVQSVIESLGTTGFPRLRMGVGRSTISKDVVGHVLERFNSAEKAQLNDYCQLAVGAIETIITVGIESAMNRFNRSNVLKKEEE